MLVVAAYGQVRMPADGALGWCDIASHQLQQCGLASTIGPNQSNSAVTVNSKLKVLQYTYDQSVQVSSDETPLLI